MDRGFKPARIVALFLVEFDMSQGYKIVWEKSMDINLNGLDYKCLPSGIHNYDSTNIVLSHFDKQLYYGLARFRQFNANHEGEMDRSKIKMYSLGILTNPLNDEKINQFSNFGWEYIDLLDELLIQYNETGNETVFEEFFNSNHQFNQVNLINHPLTKLPKFFLIFGPLIFPIIKKCLIGQNGLIFNNINHDHDSVDFFDNNCFNYLISLLSLIPKDVNLKMTPNPNTSTKPIYQVGLPDDAFLRNERGFIGSTNDDMMKTIKQIYDYQIQIESNYQDNEKYEKVTITNENNPIKSTKKEYLYFKIIYKELYKFESNDDDSSINTFNSKFKLNEQEPSWWLTQATNPISWSEYIWSAFSWFASAGNIEPCLNHPEDESNDLLKESITQLIRIVGYFHKLTKKWFQIIDEIIEDQLLELYPNLDSSNNIWEKINDKILVDLTYQDIIDLELDPYSAQDLDFITNFVLKYWNHVVDDVNIGIGIHGFCC